MTRTRAPRVLRVGRRRFQIRNGHRRAGRDGKSHQNEYQKPCHHRVSLDLLPDLPSLIGTFWLCCPSSEQLRQTERLGNGGSGSSGWQFRRRLVGVASGAARWFLCAMAWACRCHPTSTGFINRARVISAGLPPVQDCLDDVGREQCQLPAPIAIRGLIRSAAAISSNGGVDPGLLQLPPPGDASDHRILDATAERR